MWGGRHCRDGKGSEYEIVWKRNKRWRKVCQKHYGIKRSEDMGRKTLQRWREMITRWTTRSCVVKDLISYNAFLCSLPHNSVTYITGTLSVITKPIIFLMLLLWLTIRLSSLGLDVFPAVQGQECVLTDLLCFETHTDMSYLVEIKMSGNTVIHFIKV